MVKVLGFGVRNAHSDLKPISFERREPVAGEVKIDILFCGVCHSDVHQVKNEWHNTLYPCVPGHEIIGRVAQIGSAVQNFKIGDLVGVGCMVDSCKACDACHEGLEQYCVPGATATYNGNMRDPKEELHTYGGYSENITVREDFVLRIPENLDPAAAAPILCAGVTTYSPMRHWKVGPGTKLGIIGFGGLGHMATKIALALGAEVSVITTSAAKKKDIMALGVKNVVLSKNKKNMKEHEASLDFILNTIPQPHDVNLYTPLLKRDGVLTIVGCLAPLKKPLDMTKIIMDRKSIGSSLIGGIAETQEVLDFCSQHNITSTIKVISIEEVNDAYTKVDKGEVDFRFVIDMATLKGKQEAEETVVEKLFDLVN